MASSIAQCCLRVVLDTYLSEDETISQCVRKVVTCILEQGVVHPIQFIPYLIAMTTDRDMNLQHSAEQNLQDFDKTNPGIIQTKVMHGFKMSYQWQKLLAFANQNTQADDIIRCECSSVLLPSLIDRCVYFRHDREAFTPMDNQQSPFCSDNHYLNTLIRFSRIYRRRLFSQLDLLISLYTQMSMIEIGGSDR
jgi:cohesin loading factor subunit SCC2